MKVEIIQVPYDSGHYAKRMGRGPIHLIEQGFVQKLQAEGHDVESTEIRVSEDFTLEVGTAFQINRQISEKVAAGNNKQRLPVILAGNCNTCIGTLSGLNESSIGVIWFDAHGDLNTPETTPSGFFDGMAISVILGRCWQTLAQQVPGFAPIPDQNLLLIGPRDLDQAEEQFMAESQIAHLRPEAVEIDLSKQLGLLSERVGQIYLHIDLDVLDSGEVRANQYAAPNGISLKDMTRIIAEIGGAFKIKAVALTAFDPDFDENNRALEAAQKLLSTVIST